MIKSRHYETNYDVLLIFVLRFNPNYLNPTSKCQSIHSFDEFFSYDLFLLLKTI